MFEIKTVEILCEGIAVNWDAAKAEARKCLEILKKVYQDELFAFYKEEGVLGRVEWYVIRTKN